MRNFIYQFWRNQLKLGVGRGGAADDLYSENRTIEHAISIIHAGVMQDRSEDLRALWLMLLGFPEHTSLDGTYKVQDRLEGLPVSIKSLMIDENGTPINVSFRKLFDAIVQHVCTSFYEVDIFCRPQLLMSIDFSKGHDEGFFRNEAPKKSTVFYRRFNATELSQLLEKTKNVLLNDTVVLLEYQRGCCSIRYSNERWFLFHGNETKETEYKTSSSLVERLMQPSSHPLLLLRALLPADGRALRYQREAQENNAPENIFRDLFQKERHLYMPNIWPEQTARILMGALEKPDVAVALKKVFSGESSDTKKSWRVFIEFINHTIPVNFSILLRVAANNADIANMLIEFFSVKHGLHSGADYLAHSRPCLIEELLSFVMQNADSLRNVIIAFVDNITVNLEDLTWPMFRSTFGRITQANILLLQQINIYRAVLAIPNKDNDTDIDLLKRTILNFRFSDLGSNFKDDNILWHHIDMTIRFVRAKKAILIKANSLLDNEPLKILLINATKSPQDMMVAYVDFQVLFPTNKSTGLTLDAMEIQNAFEIYLGSCRAINFESLLGILGNVFLKHYLVHKTFNLDFVESQKDHILLSLLLGKGTQELTGNYYPQGMIRNVIIETVYQYIHEHIKLSVVTSDLRSHIKMAVVYMLPSLLASSEFRAWLKVSETEHQRRSLPEAMSNAIQFAFERFTTPFCDEMERKLFSRQLRDVSVVSLECIERAVQDIYNVTSFHDFLLLLLSLYVEKARQHSLEEKNTHEMSDVVVFLAALKILLDNKSGMAEERLRSFKEKVTAYETENALPPRAAIRFLVGVSTSRESPCQSAFENVFYRL